MTKQQPALCSPTCIYDVVGSSAPTKPQGKDHHQRPTAAAPGRGGGSSRTIPKISDLTHVPCIQTLAQATLQGIAKQYKKSSNNNLKKTENFDDDELSKSCHGPTLVPVHNKDFNNRRHFGGLRRSHSMGDSDKARVMLEDLLKDFNWDNSGEMRDSTSILTDYRTPNNYSNSSSRRQISSNSHMKKAKPQVKKKDSRDESEWLELRSEGEENSGTRRRKTSKSPSSRRFNRSPGGGGEESPDHEQHADEQQAQRRTTRKTSKSPSSRRINRSPESPDRKHVGLELQSKEENICGLQKESTQGGEEAHSNRRARKTTSKSPSSRRMNRSPESPDRKHHALELQSKEEESSGHEHAQRRTRKTTSKSPSNRRINRSPESPNRKQHAGRNTRGTKKEDGVSHSGRHHCLQTSKRGSPSRKMKMHNNLRRAKSTGELDGNKQQQQQIKPPVTTTKRTIERGALLLRSKSMDRHRLDLSANRGRCRLRRTESSSSCRRDNSRRGISLDNSANATNTTTTTWRRNASRSISRSTSSSRRNRCGGRNYQEQLPPLVSMQNANNAKTKTTSSETAEQQQQQGAAAGDSRRRDNKTMDSSSSSNHSSIVRSTATRRGRRSPSPMRRSPSPKRSTSLSTAMRRSPSPVVRANVGPPPAQDNQDNIDCATTSVLLGVDNNISQPRTHAAAITAASAPCAFDNGDDSDVSTEGRPQSITSGLQTMGRSGRLFTRSESGKRLGGQQMREVFQKEKEAAEREKIAAAVQAAAEEAAAEQQVNNEEDAIHHHQQDGGGLTEEQNEIDKKEKTTFPFSQTLTPSLGGALTVLDHLPIPTLRTYKTISDDDTSSAANPLLPGEESDPTSKPNITV